MGARKPKRRAYLSDFVPAADGSYRYGGAHYRFTGTAEERKHLLRRLWILTAAACLCSVGGGLLMPPNGIGNCFYVLLPLAAEVGAFGSVVWALVRLTAAGHPVRRYVYEQTAAALPRRSLIAAAAAGVGAVGALICLLFGGEGQALGRPLGYIGSRLLGGAAAAVLFRAAKSGRWEEQRHDGAA